MKSKLRAYFWLTIAIICFIAGVHQSFVQGIKDSYMFFLFTTFALLFFLFHRNMSRKASNKS